MSDEFKFEVWPTEFRQITQHFGVNPQNYAQFGLPGHEGVDIMAPMNAKVFAVAPGRIKMVETDPSKHAYGIHVRIEHRDGYETIYGHFQEARVQVGQQVQAGDLIGLADNTGNSFGSHLHITLKKQGAQMGSWPLGFIDPTPFLLPLLGWQRPASPYTDGWAYTDAIIVAGDLAQVSAGGINLRTEPSVNASLIDLVPGGTILIVTGAARGLYTPVQVPTSALSNAEPISPPTPPPSTDTNTVDGWAWLNNLAVRGTNAVVNEFGINLRATPARDGQNIGLIRAGSIVSVTGSVRGEYLPIRARRADFSGPINLPDTGSGETPPVSPLPKDGVLCWAWTQNLTITGSQAKSGQFGSNLRSAPSRSAASIGIFQEGAIAVVSGLRRGEYTPVLVRVVDIVSLVQPLPAITQPDPLPDDETQTPPTPIHDTTPGWAFSSQITVTGGMAISGTFGINLRDAPRRNATNIGFVPARASMIVTGTAQGEYTPVRVSDDILQRPFTPSVVMRTTTVPEVVDPEPAVLGQAQIGLHAAADPDISDAEVAEFAAMRPGIIKVLSFHNPNGIRKLVQQHSDASWIVRTFLDFGGRNISPQQFFNDTISDTERTLGLLQGKQVVIELHNEPNLTAEGMVSTWKDGAAFKDWWLQLLDLYRKRLPNHHFIYPGLSPGASVRGIKMDHVEFVEASRDAVKAADGLGVHIYWSNVYPMATALNVLDDYINRFRGVPIWVTEASNNKVGTAVHRKGMQYLEFWKELQKRPMVQGVTYFVASASNSAFQEEIWVGRGLGKIVGRR